MLSSWHSPFKQTGTKTNAETDGVIVTAIRARRKKKQRCLQFIIVLIWQSATLRAVVSPGRTLRLAG